MAFRIEEEKEKGLKWAVDYLTPRGSDEGTRLKVKELIEGLDLGPVVDSYPEWHPLISHVRGDGWALTPCKETGYNGLDHTVFFVNGFITCPYGDGQAVLDSVEALPMNRGAMITAEKLGHVLYNPEATPILVKCEWYRDVDADGRIPLSIAAPLMLEHEVPYWKTATCAESWESMKRNLMGAPHGGKMSFFVSQDTGVGLKRLWNELVKTGMFGGLKG